MAGYETTACCLSFTMFLLAQHQSVQDRLRKELEQLLTEQQNGKASRFYESETQTDIRCELMDRIIYESLRLYPPVVDYVIRELSDTLSTVHLESINVTVTNEMAVQVPVWAMHHDPSYWPNPNTFNPDRDNLPIPGSAQKNPAFFAFGIGQRKCIGGELAIAEIRHSIAALVLNYRIELVQNGDFDGFGGYKFDDETNLLKIQGNAELIKPETDILLKFVPIEL